jgi:hypothetical protein
VTRLTSFDGSAHHGDTEDTENKGSAWLHSLCAPRIWGNGLRPAESRTARLHSRVDGSILGLTAGVESGGANASVGSTHVRDPVEPESPDWAASFSCSRRYCSIHWCGSRSSAGVRTDRTPAGNSIWRVVRTSTQIPPPGTIQTPTARIAPSHRKVQDALSDDQRMR